MLNLFNTKVIFYAGVLLVIGSLALWANKLRHEVQHLSDSLTLCQKDIALQNSAISQIKVLQEQEDTYQKKIQALSEETLTLQGTLSDNLIAPDECHAAITWGINQAKEFKA